MQQPSASAAAAGLGLGAIVQLVPESSAAGFCTNCHFTPSAYFLYHPFNTVSSGHFTRLLPTGGCSVVARVKRGLTLGD